MRVVPELYCTNIEMSKDFYTRILQFEIKYERPEEAFVFLTREGVEIMLEGIDGDSHKFLTTDVSELKQPLGRGINFQWDVSNVDELYEHVKQLSPDNIFLTMEIKAYHINDTIVKQKQFIVKDPDGYLFRFCE